MTFLRLPLLLALVLTALTAQAGWNPLKSEDTEAERRALVKEAEAAIDAFRASDEKLGAFFANAYGWAVFPSVGKGGIGIGGAYGRGVVWRGGRVAGYATLAQLTIGLQWGGQVYSELIFFRDRDAFERFRSGKLELSAQASAVAATAGAAANADYSDGVAIFTLAKGGLMYEATVGGQKFTFEE